MGKGTKIAGEGEMTLIEHMRNEIESSPSMAQDWPWDEYRGWTALHWVLLHRIWGEYARATNNS